MAIRHSAQPTEGVQFHPESILTTGGETIIRNFAQATRRNASGASQAGPPDDGGQQPRPGRGGAPRRRPRPQGTDGEPAQGGPLHQTHPKQVNLINPNRRTQTGPSGSNANGSPPAAAGPCLADSPADQSRPGDPTGNGNT